MNFSFLHKPEVRKYNYKPQFFVPKEENSYVSGKFNSEEFGTKLKNSWKSKRKTKKNQNNMKKIMRVAFILLLLLFLVWKFVFK
jgi:hypothetical protein